MLKAQQTVRKEAINGKSSLADAAAVENKALPIHRWVPWIAGFSAQFVQDVIDSYLPRVRRTDALVLDPFAGVGTTLVESLKRGLDCVGYEVNGYAALAARAKVDSVAAILPEKLEAYISSFSAHQGAMEARIDSLWSGADKQALDMLLESLACYGPSNFRSRIPFFSLPIQAKCLYALKSISAIPNPYKDLFLVAFGAGMVSVSNYTYEPSLSSRPGAGKPLIENASVIEILRGKLVDILDDIRWSRERFLLPWSTAQRAIHSCSYFDSTLGEESVSLAVTSPPYMNNYHYVRNTRPQLHWLGLISNAESLKDYEKKSFGTFWQTVRQGPTLDLNFASPVLAEKVQYLRSINLHKGSYGGKGWANYVVAYFNDTWRFLRLLQTQLRRDAYAIVVVGNSVIQGLEFKVDHLLAGMAEDAGLMVESIEMVRETRVGTSIIRSSVRNGLPGMPAPVRLYDAAVVLKKV